MATRTTYTRILSLTINVMSESSSPSPSSMSFTPTTLQTIPVVEEKPSISKESVASNTDHRKEMGYKD